jgi:integrase
MTKLHLNYVQSFGGYHYFRRRGAPRIRLPGIPGSAEFMAAYQDALAEPDMPIGISRSKPGTVAAAVAAYLASNQFNELAPGTRGARRAIVQHFRDQYGDKLIGSMPSKFIALVLGTKKPHAARNYFKAIRALCQFGVEIEMIAADPTQGIKLPKVKTTHRRPWTPEETEQYERAHPIGTKARLAFALGLYTVQRLGDVTRMGRQHVRDGSITVRQGKTGTALILPIHPDLQSIIDATPSEHMTFLVTQTNRPYSGNDLSGQFRVWCDEAGLPNGCTFHGLRATGCTRLADAGCSTHEIAAWSGHMSLKEVERYTKSANQKKLAVSAVARIANKQVSNSKT